MGLITSVFLYTFLLQKVFADALPPQLQTVADFVTKKQSCVVAIAEVPKDEKMYKNAFSPAWRKQLLCVQDITINVGSIDEVKGCAFTWYDSTTNKYLPVQSMDSFGRAPMAIVKNKSCTSGGFEQLIKLKLGVYGASSVWGKITSASNPESKLVVIADTSASIKKLVEDGIQEAIKQEQIAANKREIAKKIADEKAKKRK